MPVRLSLVLHMPSFVRRFDELIKLNILITSI